MALQVPRRHLRDYPLVDFTHAIHSALDLILSCVLLPKPPQRVLFQASIIEPDVVIPAIVRELLFILDPPLPEDSRLERVARAVLFLEFRVRGVQRLRLGPRQAIQRKLQSMHFSAYRRPRCGSAYLVDDPRAVVLLQPRLHLRKRAKHGLGLLDLLRVVAEEHEREREHLARLVGAHALLLELRPFDPHARLGAHGDPALVYRARAVTLLVAFLELDVRLPRLVLRLSLHPTLEDLARAGDVSEQLFEIHVFVPQLVDAR